MGARSVSYTRIADRYEQIRGGDTRAVELAAALRPWVPDGLVCDVGAGTGVVTRHLARPAVRLVACDLSFEMLVQAGSRLPGRLHVAEATRLALRDASVDGLTYVWVLHHVGDLHAALGEARRVLRPRGQVVAISGLSIASDDQVSRILDRLNDRLQPRRREHALAVAPVGLEIGFALLHEGTAATTVSTSPNALADAVAERHFSPLWDLDDAVWDAIVAPAIEELRGLPEPDVARARTLRHPLVVLQR